MLKYDGQTNTRSETEIMVEIVIQIIGFKWARVYMGTYYYYVIGQEILEPSEA